MDCYHLLPMDLTTRSRPSHTAAIQLSIKAANNIFHPRHIHHAEFLMQYQVEATKPTHTWLSIHCNEEHQQICKTLKRGTPQV